MSTDDDETHILPTTAQEKTMRTTPLASPTFADQPLDDPLPYGAGFAAPVQFGYGVAPEPVYAAPAASTEVARRERAGSPVLATTGLLSMAVAVWALAGAPTITAALGLSVFLAVAVLVGLLMVVRR